MRKLTTDEWIKRAKQTHGNRYDYSETVYVNIRTLINIRCRVHGVFEQRPFDHVNGHGCPLCGFISTKTKGRNGKPFVGVHGIGHSDVPHSINMKARFIWQNMLMRCYNPTFQAKQPIYIGCVVCNEWLTFSNFKKWFDNPDNGYREGYQLDKDIIVQGNKVYSPATCCFIPQAINCLFGFNSKKRSKLPTGVFYHHGNIEAIVNCGGKNNYLGKFNTPEEAFAAYKQAKEAYIKEVARAYYQRGEITKRVYDALMVYEVGVNG